jgi:hypothetical protein
MIAPNEEQPYEHCSATPCSVAQVDETVATDTVAYQQHSSPIQCTRHTWEIPPELTAQSVGKMRNVQRLALPRSKWCLPGLSRLGAIAIE